MIDALLKGGARVLNQPREVGISRAKRIGGWQQAAKQRVNSLGRKARLGRFLIPNSVDSGGFVSPTVVNATPKVSLEIWRDETAS